MTDSSRRRSLLYLATLAGAVPVLFGVMRAVTTSGEDVRFLWLAAAALIGAYAVMTMGRGAMRTAPVSRVWTIGAVAVIVAGAAAAASALLLGATAGPGVAIVAMGFGLCAGASASLAAAARQEPA